MEKKLNYLEVFIKKRPSAFGERRSVNENGLRSMAEVADPETKAFYGFQIAIENIHSETYAPIDDTTSRIQKKEAFSMQ
jgi:ribonucleotide reductase beta subunit family protein with ferritin-like domain